MTDSTLNRRQFLAGSAAIAASTWASTYARAQGANDRIGLGIVGCGGRVRSLLEDLVHCCADGIDVVALADVWRPNREELAQGIQDRFGRKPPTFSRHQDLLAQPAVDAVVITTPDYAHTPVLIDALRAGKDAYVEKPMATKLEDAVTALDLVHEKGAIVQVGTQRRSESAFRTGAAFVRTGALGTVTKVESAWSRNVPCWVRDYDNVKQEDLDWEQFRMGLPMIPYNPAHLRRWHLYKDYTNGLVGLLGSHMIDIGTWYLDDPYPLSCVADGGIYRWTDDGREHSDTYECTFKFPKGFLLTFSCRLGAGPEAPYTAFYGSELCLDTRTWKVTSGANTPPADFAPPPLPERLPGESHQKNWLDCIRSRKQPNAPIEVGYAHSVACIMGDLAERTGRRMHYDHQTRTITPEA